MGLKLPLRLGPGLAIEEYPLELRLESEVVLLLLLLQVAVIGTASVKGVRYCIPVVEPVLLSPISVFPAPTAAALPAKHDIDRESLQFEKESVSDSKSDIGVIVIDGPIPLERSKVFGLLV